VADDRFNIKAVYPIRVLSPRGDLTGDAKGDILARYVNSNGRHEEVGESFPIDADRVAHWENLDAQQR
jgi:hypothetical protein